MVTRASRFIWAGVAVFAAGAIGLSVVGFAQNDNANTDEQDAGLDPTAQALDDMDVDQGTISYALGYDIGSNFRQQEIELEIERFLDGFRDAVEQEQAELSDEQMMQALMSFQMQMQEAQQARLGELEQEGRAFLDQNRQREGVNETDSGLQYRVIEEGQGETPAATDTVRVHYEGRLVNDEVFDSSYERGEPIEFPVNRLIDGWSEALQLMQPGAKWELYIPPELAYGERGTPDIPPNSTLIFEVELLEIVD